MKLTDYITEFLVQKGINCAFGMSGGAAVHMFDSINKHSKMSIISMTHEQCAAMAADGYSRATGKLGVAVTTSGPGATNLLTGVCCSFYDSVPTLMITGQVATHRLKGERNVRQVGFQETDVVSIFKPVTKYIVQLSDPQLIRYHLEKAYYLAFNGRPGPVLIDIPDDLQRAEINLENLVSFFPEEEDLELELNLYYLNAIINDINKAERPIIIIGGGLKTPAIDNYKEVIQVLGIPVLLTWAAIDLLDYSNPLRIGTFGVYGSRLGNFAVQNADLIITLGTRLSQNLTGGILSSFAREAKIIMVDIDQNEMTKFSGNGISISYGLKSSMFDFFANMSKNSHKLENRDFKKWKDTLSKWKSILPNDFDGKPFEKSKQYLDVFTFFDYLSRNTRANELFYADTGGNLTWTCNSLKIREGQHIFSAWNNTPMGYSLPAAIGAAFSKTNNQITCIIGDGGLMICMAELATVVRHNLPLKIFLINNHGHGIQKQTLETWLNGTFVGVDEISGLAFPKDYQGLVKAFGLKYIRLYSGSDIEKSLEEVYTSDSPCFIDVEINPNQKLFPVLKFGFPLENQMPFLDKEFLDSQMLIKQFKNEQVTDLDKKQNKEGW